MSEQRVAIVTGGARGIGAAITTRLASAETHVAAGYRRSRTAGDELAGKLTGEGYSVSLHQGNVGNPADCQRVVQDVLAQHGRVDSSKAGLIGFTKSLALELARKGITVNCVAPGFIDTDMVADVPKKTLDRIIEDIPVGRLGKAYEIARAVQFLVDDDAGYITGSVLAVNGGLDM